jgi:pimeloyl-ACP methyl ester carboxylesterase
MPAVFVPGVPDTRGVAQGARPGGAPGCVTLALPGFATLLPSGFQPTKEGYVEWLQTRLGRQAGPIDLVGHDWGALLVLRAVSLMPDLVRSWAVGRFPYVTRTIFPECPASMTASCERAAWASGSSWAMTGRRVPLRNPSTRAS